MTEALQKAAGHEAPVVQEPDRVAVLEIAVIFIVWVVVITGAILVVLPFETRGHQRAAVETAVAPPLLFGVHQTAILGPPAGQVLRLQQFRDLRSWRVSDPKTGVAQIPIDVAKRLYLEQQNAAQQSEKPTP